MNQPKVSILIPIYNAGPFLRECLDSIINQTYSNLHIIAIDDGSTDDSWAIMQEYAENDNRFEIYQQPNSGVAATRNKLLDHVRGEFILFVDSDDWIDLETIDRIMAEQKGGDYDLVSFEMIGSKNDIHETYLQEQAIKEFLRHISFRGSLWNKMIRFKCVGNIRFDEKISYGEDALFCWQLLQNTESVRITPYQLYNYRMNSVSLSHSSFDNRKFSAYYVWQQICSETENNWPLYTNTAKARYAIEMTLLLRDAARSGFTDKHNIELLQEVVRKLCPLIRKTKLSSWKMFIYSKLISRSLFIFSFIQFLNNGKGKGSMA